MKLVIQSHRSTEKALCMLLGSLFNSFTDGKLLREKVIIVLSDEPEANCSIMQDFYGFTAIKTSVNNFEFTSPYAISKTMGHPLIKDDAYLLIHDSCLTDSSFCKKFFEAERQIKSEEFKGFDFAPVVFYGQFNICILSYKFLRDFGDNYGEVEISKNEALFLEWGIYSNAPLSYYSYSRKSLPLYPDSGVSKPPKRDIYNEGEARAVAQIPRLGLYKFFKDQISSITQNFVYGFSEIGYNFKKVNSFNEIVKERKRIEKKIPQNFYKEIGLTYIK